jgi:hypothetical protein
MGSYMGFPVRFHSGMLSFRFLLPNRRQSSHGELGVHFLGGDQETQNISWRRKPFLGTY